MLCTVHWLRVVDIQGTNARCRASLPDPLLGCPVLTAYKQRFEALPQLATYLAGPLHRLQ